MKPSLIYPHINIGVEVEAEQVYRTADEMSLTGWRGTHDGSLRDGGVEIVFDGPTCGREAELRISTGLRALERYGARSSYRTSIHVHLDTATAGLGSKGIVRAIALYALVERALFTWEGNHRECSNFCVPLFKASQALDTFASIVADADNESRQHRLRMMEEMRYSALNLHALSKFGTLEFRHLLTTFDANRVITWVNLCSSILVAANNSRIKMEAFLDWVATAQPDEIVRSIFKEEHINELGLGELVRSVQLGRPIAVSFLSATGMVSVPEYVPEGKGEFYNHTIASNSNPLATKLRQKYGV